MASSRALLYNYDLSTLSLPCKKSRSCYQYSFQVRAQSYHEGRSSRNSYNIVDANLRVLRERIEQVKNKERRCTVVDESTAAGWNYSAADQDFIFGRKREKEMIHQFVQLVGTIGGTFGLTILGCTFCLCIVSLLAHLN
ncbi:hypothetical protein ACJIZ3_002318 [Penstemon smallii]|uniref:Uncharacterized protein n=1 Tax=Penstemon smallii TaxID=265156 RepID=A0ABD3U904_9LAMI